MTVQGKVRVMEVKGYGGKSGSKIQGSEWRVVGGRWRRGAADMAPLIAAFASLVGVAALLLLMDSGS